MQVPGRRALRQDYPASPPGRPARPRAKEHAIASEIQERLTKYLTDAHSIEEQALAQLRAAPDVAGDPELAAAFRVHLTETEGLAGHPTLATLYEEHLAETRDHAELVAERLRALGGDPSSLKDAAMRLGALTWGGFFAGHPDTPGKLAAFAHAFEHLEIGGYEQLKRVARRAGDEETAQLADRILEQERTAARRLANAFDEAAEASLAASLSA